MIVDPEEITFEAPDLDGTIKTIEPMWNKRNRNDGWLMTSRKYLNRVNKVMGSHALALKTAIRHLSIDRKDYIAVKMSEQVPYEGTIVYRKGEDGSRILVAEYKEGTWKDGRGNEFDRLGTTDEVKDTSGYYNEMYTIRALPEESTKIIITYDRSPEDGAHPILGHELLFDEDYIKNNPEVQKQVKAVRFHYEKIVREYMSKLMGFIKDPNSFRDFVSRKLLKGELPQEVQQYVDLFPDGRGLFIQQITRQLEPMVNNRILNDGLYKVRQLDSPNATHVLIKPRMAMTVPRESIVVSSNNRTVMKWLLKAAKIDPTGKSMQELVNEVNNWLEDHSYWVLVHRQPIQSFTKVQPRKIHKILYNHGEVAVLSEEDVFNVHEADFDGDTIFIERFDDPNLIQAMRNVTYLDDFKSRDRIVDLDLFVKGNLGASLSSANGRLRLIDEMLKLRNARGLVVNAKTLLVTLSYKNIELQLDKLPNTIFKPYNPTERDTMWYWKIDKDYLTPKVRKSIEDQGDNLVQKGDDFFLNTTKENEFSILLQASVDNETYGLLNNIDLSDMFMGEWLITRMFKRSDGIGWQRKDIRAIRAVYGTFNYSQDRQGITQYNTNRSLLQNLKRSGEIANTYYDVDGKVREAGVVSELIFEDLKDKQPAIVSFTTNGRMTPSEFMLAQPSLFYQKLEEDIAETGRTLYSPVRFENDSYTLAHAQTMKQLEADLVAEGRKEDLKEVNRGIEFGIERNREFYIAMDKRIEKISKKVTKLNINIVLPKYEFDEVFSKFSDKFYPQFLELSDTEQKWATIEFLRGARTYNLGGEATRVQKVLVYPPIWLMHQPTIQRYGNLYYDNLMKPDVSGFTAERTRFPSLTKFIQEIRGACG
jgi:hypothetical protein